MKKRRIFISLVVAMTILILGGCGMTSQKETLTKEQQDNVVKRIARGYNIQSIEFTAFSKDKKTGTYLLNIKINNSDSLETTIPFRNLERLSNEPFGEFSNFSPYGFFDDSGLYWPTSEHYFQARKFEQKELREKIRLLSNPKAAALDDAYDAVRNGLGKAVKGTWNSVTSWFGGGAKYA